MQERERHPYQQQLGHPGRSAGNGLGPRHPRRHPLRPSAQPAPAPAPRPSFAATQTAAAAYRPARPPESSASRQTNVRHRSGGSDRRRNLWDRCWKDSEGRLAIWQTPNAPLIGWAVLTTASLFFTGRMADVLSGLASASLIFWCFLEISRGVNYFRRVLGLAILIYAVAALIKAF